MCRYSLLSLSLFFLAFCSNQMYIEKCDKDEKFIPSHAHHIEQTLTREIALIFFLLPFPHSPTFSIHLTTPAVVSCPLDCRKWLIIFDLSDEKFHHSSSSIFSPSFADTFWWNDDENWDKKERKMRKSS